MRTSAVLFGTQCSIFNGTLIVSTIPTGPLNVLIIAEGNTGSEFLLHLLSVVKDGISVFEPFRNFKYDGKVLPGQYGGLYNCSFAVDGGLLSQVCYDAAPTSDPFPAMPTPESQATEALSGSSTDRVLSSGSTLGLISDMLLMPLYFFTTGGMAR